MKSNSHAHLRDTRSSIEQSVSDPFRSNFGTRQPAVEPSELAHRREKTALCPPNQCGTSANRHNLIMETDAPKASTNSHHPVVKNTVSPPLTCGKRQWLSVGATGSNAKRMK